MKRALSLIAVVLVTLAGASASAITDNFESYALGTFPSPTWLDAGLPFADPRTPIPSATVVSTTDAFGHLTQALQIANAVSNSRGIYAPVAISSQYSLAADIRVDQYSDHPQTIVGDWPMELSFAQTGTGNFDAIPQAGIYASSLTGGWRLFSQGAVFADIDLGVPATIGTWYYVQLSFDVGTATFHSVIENATTGNVLVDRFDIVAGLTLANTQYNSIAFFAGENSSADTVGDVGTVDNVNISATTPEPGTLLMLGTGIIGAIGAIRRKVNL